MIWIVVDDGKKCWITLGGATLGTNSENTTVKLSHLLMLPPNLLISLKFENNDNKIQP